MEVRRGIATLPAKRKSGAILRPCRPFLCNWEAAIGKGVLGVAW